MCSVPEDVTVPEGVPEYVTVPEDVPEDVTVPEDYSKLSAEDVTVSRPSYSVPEDPRLCEAEFFKDTNSNWSWVGKNCLCAVEDQGKSWTCWAFVGAEAITALYYIKLKVMKPLSKQHVIDCLFTVMEAPKGIRYQEETGCFTSHYNTYFKFAIKEGVYSDESYPYIGSRTHCRKLLNEEKTKIKEFIKVDDLDLDTKGIEELIQNQPICGCVDLPESFQKHKGKDIYVGKTKRDSYVPSGGSHAVLVIGFGVENGVAYYVIKNSWGIKWGYWGYGRVKRSLVKRLSFPVLHE